MRILVIEPDEYYHPHFHNVLGQLGEVIIRTDGADFEDILQASPPDALVTELILPTGSGYQILEQIQKLNLPIFFPVIIFSKIGHLEDIEAALNFGVNAYFLKGQDTVNDIKKSLLNLANDYGL